MSPVPIYGRTIRELIGGGGGGTKKYSRKGKLNLKKLMRANEPKKIFMLWPKKNSYREFDNEKKFLRLENSRRVLSVLSRYPEGVIRLGLRPRRITPSSSISTILHKKAIRYSASFINRAC